MSTYYSQSKKDLEKLATEVKIKEERIRELLVEEQLDGVILSKNYNFAWLTAGGNNRIVNNRETGAAEILITNRDKYILTNNLEERRLREEEVFNQNFTFLRRKWYQDKSLDNLISGLKLGSDLPVEEMKYVGKELSELRYSLTEFELERYRRLGGEVAQIVSNICQDFKRGISENEVAARVVKGLREAGIYTVSLLVAADERISKYCHPQPTNKEANNRLMISLAAERGGLVVSLTRMVAFKSLSYQLSEQLEDLLKIESIYLNGTQAGQEVNELFNKAVAKYQELGYEEAWEFDDHGGALGYKVRDYLATTDCEKEIQANQPFAWTPTLPGLKLEDTVIATESGPEIITSDDDWPKQCYKVNGKEWQRPDILIL